ncbi:MAG: TMEM175 family protein [Ignavibacteria bacterium]
MLRKSLIKNKSNYTEEIKWRSNEVLRIEALSDAVFAFSITLLIVSLEVPESFEEMLDILKGFFAFAISFTLLFQIWYSQFKYFRRYGLQDFYITVVNGALLFVVLFYMYPLKFLFSLLIPGGRSAVPDKIIITTDQVPLLMIIYGAGYVAINILFVMLYMHSLRNKSELELTEREVFETRTQVYKFVVLALIGLCSILFSIAVAPQYAGNAGWFYGLIGPVLGIFFSIRGRSARKKFHVK